MSDEPDAPEDDQTPKQWAMMVEGKTVLLKDLPLAAVIRIVDGFDTGDTMIALLAQPLSDIPRAVKIAEECAKVAGVPESWVSDQLEQSWMEFTKLFVQVDDDLPAVVMDGIPPVGDAGSTDI
jgi:hypothetical protein